ncbi:MAG: hypothetical protein ACX939_06425 [Hyphococcus sp.]
MAAILAAALAAVVFSQIVTASHAAKYGDGPHEHGGQVCVLSLTAPAADKLLSGTVLALVVSVVIWRVANHAAETERSHVLVRAARPRGPPYR